MSLWECKAESKREAADAREAQRPKYKSRPKTDGFAFDFSSYSASLSVLVVPERLFIRASIASEISVVSVSPLKMPPIKLNSAVKKLATFWKNIRKDSNTVTITLF